MRILLLTNLYPSYRHPTGGVFINHRLRALRDRGADVDALAIVPDRPRIVNWINERRKRPSASLDPAATSVLPVRQPMSLPQYAEILVDRYPDSLIQRFAERVSDLVDLNSYDFVVAHGMYAVPAGSIAAEVASRSGLPYAVYLHGSDVNLVMPKRQDAYLDVLQGADISFFVSKALQRRAAALGFSSSNWGLSPNGVDLDMFPLPIASNQNERAQVCFVGSLITVKGADRLPRIFQSVKKSVPHANLVVVGDGPLAQSLQARTQGLDVSFLGSLPQAEVAEIMARSQAVVLPSRNEGWPCVVLESYASGTPVVASRVGGLPEAVHDVDYLVDDGDDMEERFAERIVRALGDKTRGAQLRSYAERFSWDHLAGQELERLKKVAGQRRGRSR